MKQDDNARAPVLRVLSAGAPKTGVSKCAQAFGAEADVTFDIEFATAPVLRDRVVAGNTGADVLVAPVEALRYLTGDGQVEPEVQSVVGSITAGVVVRCDAEAPDLNSVEALRQALLAADTLVYNQASSGKHVGEMLVALGIAEQARDKAVQLPTGRAVMQYVAQPRRGTTIGFGQITEIRLHEHLGVRLAGPLPAPIGKVTTYAAGVIRGAAAAELARDFVRFLSTGDARAILESTGVEP